MQEPKPFGLTDREKQPPDAVPEPPSEPIHHVWRRLKAKKAVRFHSAASDKGPVAKKIAALAAEHKDKGSAVLIFARTLDDVETVQRELAKTKRPVALLTGTMRGKERDRLADPRRADGSPVFARFLKPPKPDAHENDHWKIVPTPGTVYLVCTSAGEVGIDISADHMVCDLSTFESMAQRFGRVNRYGNGDGR